MLPIIFSISVLVFFVNSYYLKNISFDGVGSDAKKHTFAASQYMHWGIWPSGMHKFALGKAWMKDVGVLFTLFFQKILKDNHTFRPNLMVANLSHCLSGLLIFSMSARLVSEEISLIIFLLYMFSPWSYMIMSHAGLQLLGQFLFLLSIFVLPTSYDKDSISLLFYFLSGALIALSNFSSASSRKLNPLYLFFLFLSINEYSSLNDLLLNRNLSSFQIYFVIFTFTSLLFSYLIVFLNKNLTAAIYEDKLFIKFQAKDNQTIEYYEKKIEQFTKYVFKLYAIICSIILIFVLSFNETISYFYLLACVFGLIIGCLIFLLPNLFSNLRGFYTYSIIETDWGSHYPLYYDYFLEKYGVIYEKGKEGLVWYALFYFRMIPLEALLFILCPLLFLLIPSQSDIPSGIFIFFLIPLLPVIYGELTTGPKASLPLYTTYVGFFIPLIITFYFNSDFLTHEYLIFFCLTILLVLRNIFIILTDIFPSRSSVCELDSLLSEKGITEFFTIKTEFNYPFIDVLLDQFPNKYTVSYLRSVNEFNTGHLFIPCLSSLAPYYQSSKVATVSDIDREQWDDIVLKSIEKDQAIAISTLGGSKYWRTIGNVCAFRDLLLHEKERENRQNAWLIEA